MRAETLTDLLKEVDGEASDTPLQQEKRYAFAYIRVSTDDQDENAQRADIAAYAEANNIGILDGDYVLARQQSTAHQGEIIVAVIDDEATVKRYFVDGTGVRLEAENEEYESILVDPQFQDFRIAGKVVSLMRRF